MDGTRSSEPPDRARRRSAARAGEGTSSSDKADAPGQDASAHLPLPTREGLSRLSHGQVLDLQRTVGNRAVGRALHRSDSPAVQRSPLSDDLQVTWIIQGKEPFFERLSSLQQTDPDVNAFVESTLTGSDLRRARRILGTDQPLSDAQRNALFTQLVSRLGSAETFFAQAAQQVHERIQAEAQAQADLIAMLVTVGITYVVPGLGAGISRLVNNIPASASTGMHAIALGIQSRAPAIASAIGEAGKRRAPVVVRAALAQSPRDVLNALVQGFAGAKDEIVSHVQANIQNRSALPDEDLWVYVANWDPAQRTISQYATRIRDQYDRWRQQVAAIGPVQQGRRSTIEGDRPYTTQLGVVWARHSSGDVLVQARVTDGRLSFTRFIDADLAEMALTRAATTQPRGVQTVAWDEQHIAGLPASVPSRAARRR